jgi:hypothetical protein
MGVGVMRDLTGHGTWKPKDLSGCESEDRGCGEANFLLYQTIKGREGVCIICVSYTHGVRKLFIM